MATSRARRDRRRAAVACLTALGALAWGSLVVAPAEAVTAPSARRGNAMATDPATGKVVMFGGTTATGESDETWLWNGSSWSRPSPATRPPARHNASMAEDPSTGTIVLFGGQTNTKGFSDTWTWDGTTKTWTEQPVSQNPGVLGSRRAMAYDGATGTVVLFDLFSVSSLLLVTQTWTWDGTAKTWTLEDPPTQPEWRDETSMAYDAASQKVVLFGGDNSEIGGPRFNDTWTWDGRTKNWTKETPPTSPEPRGYAQMAYHSASSRVVLFGGQLPFPGNDTWTWDGASRSWTKQQPLNRPCRHSGGAMAYHPATASTVLFGGGPFSCPSSSSTWGWNGTNWKRRT